MLHLRRLAIFAVISSALIALGIFSGKWFPKKTPEPSEALSTHLDPNPQTAKPSDDSAWRKRDPWLFSDALYAPYWEAVLRPWLRRNGLGPGNLLKRVGYLEAVFPRGRPVHEIAYEFESICETAGLRVIQGQELDPPWQRLEYQVKTATASDKDSALTVRISLGTASLPGAARLALILVGLDTLSAESRARLLAFPLPLTLVVMACDSGGVGGRWTTRPPDKEILADLPMEPTAYPFIKPGPGALFIHHSREQVERLMAAKMSCLPDAIGFATLVGDRVIENRPMLKNVLGYAAARSMLFLDLTASPRSLTNSVAQQTGANAMVSRVQEPLPKAQLENELARRCGLAQKSGEGLWVIRYSPSLIRNLEGLLRQNEGRFEQIGLEWVTLSQLRHPRSSPVKGFAGPRAK